MLFPASSWEKMPINYHKHVARMGCLGVCVAIGSVRTGAIPGSRGRGTIHDWQPSTKQLAQSVEKTFPQWREFQVPEEEGKGCRTAETADVLYKASCLWDKPVPKQAKVEPLLNHDILIPKYTMMSQLLWHRIFQSFSHLCQNLNNLWWPAFCFVERAF